MTLFEITVEEDLDEAVANKILAAMEEILGKNNLSLDDSSWNYM